MPKSRNPCSAIQRCSLSENRRRRPFVRAQARRIRPARANLYTTDTAGGTVPNWKVMASQVDPQMRTEVRYKPRLLIRPSTRPPAQLQSTRNPVLQPATVSLSDKMRRRREGVRIATWNVNGLRARLEFLVLWLRERRPDLVGLQELKLTEEQFPHSVLETEGYRAVVHGQKAWNGVAILSRHPVTVTQKGLPGQEEFGNC